MTLTINQPLEVNAVTFVNRRGFKSVPRRITVGPNQYAFIDSGLQYLVQKGQHLIRLMDMTDDYGATYRLRQENDNWTLVNIRTPA